MPNLGEISQIITNIMVLSHTHNIYTHLYCMKTPGKRGLGTGTTTRGHWFESVCCHDGYPNIVNHFPIH